MNVVTRLETVNTRTKVYINGEIAFMLYKGELKKFHITEGEVIKKETFGELMSLLYNRAKERALYLLDQSYKTEKEIRDKLKSGFYPEGIIEKVIAFLKEYNLINDLRYAGMYIDYKKQSKSKKQIVQDLYKKGISKDILDIAFEESGFSDMDSLEQLIKKRSHKYDFDDYKSVSKLYQYLVGKGYQYSDVKSAIQKYSKSIDLD